MAGNTFGRQVIVPLTNKSGGSVIAGDVVVIDTANNEAFTTTTSAAFVGGVGVAQESIANNAVGRVLIEGYAALVLVNASVTRGNFGATHTVAKQAADAGAARATGTFCQFLTGGTTPTARVYPVDLGAGSGAPTTADYLVGTAQGALSAEIVVGATPGGELGGTWAAPTVDATHSGSAHLLAANTGIIGVKNYAPTTQTVYTITSTSMADVDATNLAVVFTAPASGNVIVDLSAWADITANAEYFWGLRESTTDLTGIVRVLRANASEGYITARIYLTGVTGGSHTYKWSAGVAATTTGRIIIMDGSAINEWGPAVMTVTACP